MHDKAVDEVRALARRREVSLEALPAEPAARGPGGCAQREELEELSEWLNAGLAAMSGRNKEYADLVRAHYLGEQSNEELAARLGCSVDAIKGRIKRALNDFRRWAEKHPPGGELP